MRLVDLQDRKRHHLEVAEELKAAGVFPRSFADVSMRNHLELVAIIEERIASRQEPEGPFGSAP